MARILVVDDEESIRFTFEMFLAEEGHAVDAVSGLREALSCMARYDFDILFSDVILGDGSGFDVLREVSRRNPTCPVILTTGFQHFEAALMALSLGAFDYLQKPVRQQVLLEVTERALVRRSPTGGRDRSRSNLEAIFRSVENPIVTVDQHIVVAEVNDAATRNCRLSLDLIGKELELPCGDCSAHCLRLLRETLAGRQEAGPEWFVCSVGPLSGKHLSAATYPLLDLDGRFSGAILVMRQAAGYGRDSRFKARADPQGEPAV